MIISILFNFSLQPLNIISDYAQIRANKLMPCSNPRLQARQRCRRPLQLCCGNCDNIHLPVDSPLRPKITDVQFAAAASHWGLIFKMPGPHAPDPGGFQGGFRCCPAFPVPLAENLFPFLKQRHLPFLPLCALNPPAPESRFGAAFPLPRPAGPWSGCGPDFFRRCSPPPGRWPRAP